jgi:hypothetical protein
MSSTAHSTLTLMLGRWRQCGSHVPGARHPVPLPILHGPSAATHSATRRSASAYGPPSVFRRDPYLSSGCPPSPRFYISTLTFKYCIALLTFVKRKMLLVHFLMCISRNQRIRLSHQPQMARRQLRHPLAFDVRGKPRPSRRRWVTRRC